jgi:hypothetical protein
MSNKGRNRLQFDQMLFYSKKLTSLMIPLILVPWYYTYDLITTSGEWKAPRFTFISPNHENSRESHSIIPESWCFDAQRRCRFMRARAVCLHSVPGVFAAQTSTDESA